MHRPVEASQLPFYRLLGTPEKNKMRVVYESGHGALPRQERIRETLDWLDRYLGTVNHLPGSGAKGTAARP